jgi:hypothetical protein
MAREPSENMCKLARLELFRPSAIEGGDITILRIHLFIYNLLLNNKHSDIFPITLPSALPSALASTSKNT